MTSYITLICISLRAKTKPCSSFCSPFLFTLSSREQRVLKSQVPVNLQSQCYTGGLVALRPVHLFSEALMRWFVIAPEWSSHWWRACRVPSPVMGRYIPDRSSRSDKKHQIANFSLYICVYAHAQTCTHICIHTYTT